MAAALPKDAVLIEFIRFTHVDLGTVAAEQSAKSHYAAFCLTAAEPESVPLFSIWGGRAYRGVGSEFRQALPLRLSRVALRTRTARHVTPSGASCAPFCSTTYLPPLGRMGSLILSADGELVHVPFQACR